MDAITMLKDDHDRVKKILNELEETTERAVKTRTELFAKVEAEIRLHEEIEETILYPAFKAHETLKDIVLEGYEEHHVADMILAELDGVDVTDETWGSKLKVLKESLEHHIEEEEEKMFPRARKEFSRTQMAELGRQMQAIKDREQGKQLKAA